MAVILPFEKDYYTRHNVAATFVGHPLLDSYSPIEEMKADDTDDAGYGGRIASRFPGQ